MDPWRWLLVAIVLVGMGLAFQLGRLAGALEMLSQRLTP